MKIKTYTLKRGEYIMTLRNHRLHIKYTNENENWKYWDIEIWDKLGDNYVGCLFVVDHKKDSCAYNLNLVNKLLIGLNIKFEIEGD